MNASTHGAHAAAPATEGHTLMAAVRMTLFSCLINVVLAAVCGYHGVKAIAALPSDNSVARLTICVFFGCASVMGTWRTFTAYRHPHVASQGNDPISRKDS